MDKQRRALLLTSAGPLMAFISVLTSGARDRNGAMNITAPICLNFSFLPYALCGPSWR